MTFSSTFKRLRLAFRYVFGRLSDEEALLIIADCRKTAGWHPLLVLDRADVLKEARVIFVENPHLRRLTDRACLQVERNCVGRWNELDHARAWAIKLVQDYAKEEGIALTRWDSVLSASPESTRVSFPLLLASPDHPLLRQEASS